MIVIDVGAARYDNAYSVEHLVEEFHPRILYAFDPNLSDNLLEAVDPTFDFGKTWINWSRRAAWTYDGEIGFVSSGTTSHLGDAGTIVSCFDLARFIHDIPPDEEIVLKIDAETSEYDLLQHLIKTGADKHLLIALVEWHCVSCGRGGGGHRPDCPDPIDLDPRQQWIEENIRCDLRKWEW